MYKNKSLFFYSKKTREITQQVTTFIKFSFMYTGYLIKIFYRSF